MVRALLLSWELQPLLLPGLRIPWLPVLPLFTGYFAKTTKL